MAKKVIHLGTQILCNVAIVDESGEVIERKQSPITIERLTPEAFQQAYADLVAAKAQLEQEIADDSD